MPDSKQALDAASQFGSITGRPGEPCSIPASDVRSGIPVMRSQEHSTTVDGSAWTVVWDCTRSAFDWHYDVDEVVVILEGSVRVTDRNGTTHTLKVGDAGYFPAGTSWFWEVDDYVRKVAFCHNPIPHTMRLPVRIVRKLAREFRKRSSIVPRITRWLGRTGRTASVMLVAIPL